MEIEKDKHQFMEIESTMMLMYLKFEQAERKKTHRVCLVWRKTFFNFLMFGWSKCFGKHLL